MRNLSHQSGYEELNLDLSYVPSSIANHHSKPAISPNYNQPKCNKFRTRLRGDESDFNRRMAGSSLRTQDNKLRLLGKEDKDLLIGLQDFLLDGIFCDGKVKTPSIAHSKALERHKDMLRKYCDPAPLG